MPIDFKLSNFFYPITILKIRRFLESSQWKSAATLKAIQEKKLLHLIKHAYANVPYYRKLFDEHNIDISMMKNTEYFRRIPLLTKEQLNKFNKELISFNSFTFKPVKYLTTGTTSQPTSIYWDKNTRALEIAHYWRHWSWCGYHIGNNFAELFARYFISTPGKEKKVSYFNPIVRRLLLNRALLNKDNVELYLKELYEYSPVFLRGPAVALYFFSMYLRSKGRCYTKLKGIYSTGEMLLDYQRKIIEETFSCKVYDSFGHIEVGTKISQCQFGRYHVDADYGMTEFKLHGDLITSNSQNPIIGEVISTSLGNYGMPLIRYQLGELIELYKKDVVCECKRGLPLVKKLHGRQEDIVVRHDGKGICDLYEIFNSVRGILIGQVIQKSLYKIEVRVAKAENFSNKSEKEIIHYLKDRLSSRVSISIHYLSASGIYSKPLEKVRPVISEVESLW